MLTRATAIDLIGPSSRPTTRTVVRHIAALLAVAGAVALLEVSLLDLDHGTHLLVILTLVIGIALLLGPGPATTGFAAGGGLAGGASLVTIQGALGTPLVYVQLLTYLMAGTAFIVLAAFAVRARRRPAVLATRPSTADPKRPRLVESLTARELEVLRLAATGISVDEMAGRLFVSPNTVKTHLTHIYAKLGVRGRTDAVRAALHCGCLTAGDICPHLTGDEAA